MDSKIIDAAWELLDALDPVQDRSNSQIQAKARALKKALASHKEP